LIKKLAQRIQEAKEMGYDLISDNLRKLSATTQTGVTKKTTTKDDGTQIVELVEYDNVQSKKLQIDTTKHLLGIWNRAKFGTKVDGSVATSVLIRNDFDEE
jgi:hypothetical protein